MSTGRSDFNVPLFARTGDLAIVYLVLAAITGWLLAGVWETRSRITMLREEGIKIGGRIVAIEHGFRRGGPHRKMGPFFWKPYNRWGWRSFPYPVVEFNDEKGKTWSAEALDSYEGLLIQPVGRRVTVVYAKSNPKIAEIWEIYDDFTIPSQGKLVNSLYPHADYGFYTALFFTTVFGLMAVYSLSGPIHRYLFGIKPFPKPSITRKKRKNRPQGIVAIKDTVKSILIDPDSFWMLIAILCCAAYVGLLYFLIAAYNTASV